MLKQHLRHGIAMIILSFIYNVAFSRGIGGSENQKATIPGRSGTREMECGIQTGEKRLSLIRNDGGDYENFSH